MAKLINRTVIMSLLKKKTSCKTVMMMAFSASIRYKLAPDLRTKLKRKKKRRRIKLRKLFDP